MTLAEALDYAEAYMLRGERPRVDLSEVVAVLRREQGLPPDTTKQAEGGERE